MVIKYKRFWRNAEHTEWRWCAIYDDGRVIPVDDDHGLLIQWLADGRPTEDVEYVPPPEIHDERTPSEKRRDYIVENIDYDMQIRALREAMGGNMGPLEEFQAIVDTARNTFLDE